MPLNYLTKLLLIFNDGKDPLLHKQMASIGL